MRIFYHNFSFQRVKNFSNLGKLASESLAQASNMNIISLAILVLPLAIFSCDSKSFPGLINDCTPREAYTPVDLVISKKIEIDQPANLDGMIPNYTYGEFNNQEYIVYCGNGQAIQFFNMTTGKFEAVIEPNKEVPFINEIGNIYVHNLDSIFLTRDVPPKVFLVDKGGSLINQWDLTGAPINWGNTTDYALFKSHAGFHVEDDQFYIALSTSMFFGIKERAGLRTQAIYNYKKDSWDTVYGVLPPFYSTDDNIEFISAFTYPHRVFVGDEHIISYPQSHEIHQYDKDGNLIDTYCASSEYVPTLDQPLLKSTSSDRQAGFLRFSASPSYLSFFYHKDLNIYTRLVRHKFDINAPDGKLRSPCEIEYSLIVLNEDLQKIDEVKLDDFLYDWRFARATANGFWLMPICDIWPGEEVMNYTTHIEIIL